MVGGDVGGRVDGLGGLLLDGDVGGVVGGVVVGGMDGLGDLRKE